MDVDSGPRPSREPPGAWDEERTGILGEYFGDSFDDGWVVELGLIEQTIPHLSDGVRVVDQGTQLSFVFLDLLRYAGPGSPASLAMAYQAMRLSFPLLDGGKPPIRREIGIETAYRGPGARDGFELVTRAVTHGRYLVTPMLEHPERGVTLHKFVFRVAYHDRQYTLLVRPGMVDDEFMAMARAAERSEEDEQRFAEMKVAQMTRVLAAQPGDVFEVVGP